jgi:hypothetical protein
MDLMLLLAHKPIQAPFLFLMTSSKDITVNNAYLILGNLILAGDISLQERHTQNHNPVNVDICYTRTSINMIYNLLFN